jgi:hypothetical protein
MIRHKMGKSQYNTAINQPDLRGNLIENKFNGNLKGLFFLPQ